MEVEKLAAADWRKLLAELDLKRVALQMLGIEKRKCRTLEEARDFAYEIVNAARFALASLLFHIPPHPGMRRIVDRWQGAGQPTFEKFAARRVACRKTSRFSPTGVENMPVLRTPHNLMKTFRSFA